MLLARALVSLAAAAALIVPAAAQGKDRYCGNLYNFQQVTTSRVSCGYADKFIHRGNFHLLTPQAGYYSQPYPWWCHLRPYSTDHDGVLQWTCAKRKRVITFLDLTYYTPLNNYGQPDPAPVP